MANAVKNYKQYDYISRYEGFPYYYDPVNNRYYYGITSSLNTDTSYSIYEVKAGDNYDSIALDYYGCALFYWVICDYNEIFDSLEPPAIGTQLKLPALNNIRYVQK